MVAFLSKESYLNNLLLELKEKNVSDIHIKSDHKIYCRINGDIVVLENSKELSSDDIINNLQTVLNNRIKTEFMENMQADFGFSATNKTRYRANLYKTTNGVSLALRTINSDITPLDKLGAPEVLKKIANLQKGLVIISGPTGSGKSTTLNSIIDYINTNHKKHIITLEDPIEFIHTNKNCLIDQREVGNDAKSFSMGIKSALREDPDIILIGEIRDAESIKECLNAAETGHLVFTTMHTQTASKSIDRIVDSCDSAEKELIKSMLSTSIQAVILQKLIKTVDGQKRVPAFEVMLGVNSIRNLIRENKISNIDSMIQMGSKYGMIDMKTSIENLYNNGIISKEEMDNNLINLNESKDS
ncbi:MAG: PilT/PilU family type 4a pilus ATPase [Rickettsiales bacterium]|nr:PilT/PilU family type 4a pilus ATPase [Rickettsiales bacterium]